MIQSILKNNLYVMAALAAAVALFLASDWNTLSALQRLSGLFFVGLVMHLWEEGRFPGGFVELITAHLHFTARSRTFGEVVTAGGVLIIAFVPLFFPSITFLTMAAMTLGVIEAIMHTAMIRMFRLKHFYSPGLVTALGLLLPISLIGFGYFVRHGLLQPIYWVLAFLYMLVVLVGAQQIVIRASGVKYADFLEKVRAGLANPRDA